jgi:hypothetical protein
VAVRQLMRIEKGLFHIRVYEYFCYVTTERLTQLSQKVGLRQDGHC